MERDLTLEEKQQLDNWFRHHPPTEDQADDYATIRLVARHLAETICKRVPPSADRTAALRKLRECVMTANAGIACGGK